MHIGVRLLSCSRLCSDVYHALKTVVNVSLVVQLKLPGFEPRMWQKRVDGPFHRELTRMIVNCCYSCNFLR